MLFKEWIEGDGKEWLDNKCFKGFFSLNPSFVRLVAKSKSYEEFFKLEETIRTSALPEADIKGGSNRSGGDKSKGQSHYEVLKDRFNFLKEIFGVDPETSAPETFANIAASLIAQ